MMKKILLIIIILLQTQDVKADICTFVDRATAEKAVGILQNQTEFIDYCSLCEAAQPQTVKIKTVDIQIPQADDKSFKTVYVNQKAVDLAYAYIRNGKKYENLAYLSGCEEAKKHNIRPFENTLPIKKEISKEEMYKKSRENAEAIVKKCDKKAFLKKSYSTQYAIDAAIDSNDCIALAIKQQIEFGFEPQEQTELYLTIADIKYSTNRFYELYFNSNKYCKDRCGLMAQLYQQNEVTKQLKKILEDLIFLNMAKKGY